MNIRVLTYLARFFGKLYIALERVTLFLPAPVFMLNSIHTVAVLRRNRAQCMYCSR